MVSESSASGSAMLMSKIIACRTIIRSNRARSRMMTVGQQLSRREFSAVVAGSLMLPAPEGGAGTKPINGVRIGVQTYSFRELPRNHGVSDAVDVVIGAMQACGLDECELWSPQIEPSPSIRP